MTQIIPPRREELITSGREVTQRYIKFFESLSTNTNNVDPILEYINDTKLQIYIAGGDYSAAPGNYIIMVDASLGPVQIELPDATNSFLSYGAASNFGISKIDTSANPVTIVSAIGSQTVVGEPSQQLLLDGEILNVTTDGTNWELSA